MKNKITRKNAEMVGHCIILAIYYLGIYYVVRTIYLTVIAFWLVILAGPESIVRLTAESAIQQYVPVLLNQFLYGSLIIATYFLYRTVLQAGNGKWWDATHLGVKLER